MRFIESTRIPPTVVAPEILYRDITVMGALTLVLFAVCLVSRATAQLPRFGSAALLSVFGGYSAYVMTSTVPFGARGRAPASVERSELPRTSTVSM